MNRRSRVNQIMYDIKLKDEWKKRLERQRYNKSKIIKAGDNKCTILDEHARQSTILIKDGK